MDLEAGKLIMHLDAFVDNGSPCLGVDCNTDMPATHPRFYQGKSLEPLLNFILSLGDANECC